MICFREKKGAASAGWPWALGHGGQAGVRVLWALLICLGLAGSAGNAWAGGKEVIKFATLAPEGSSWMKEMRRLADEVEKETGGEVRFKFYPGGVSGDELDVIRKMRIGQVHGAGFTGVGLGEILPEVRVLDLPFLFADDKEVQRVYERMNDYFVRRFEEKGYVLLGWVPVGWVHFFSSREVKTVDDLKIVKAWMWQGDPLVEAAYNALDIRPVPLSVSDVLLSLQTGIVDTVYASPQGALALQWFSKVKHMSSFPMGYATGGVLITKKKYDRLPDKFKDALARISSRHLQGLVQTIQDENNQSVQVIRDNGVALSPPPSPEAMKQFREAGAQARKSLTGKLFDQKLLDTVLSHLKASP